MVELGHAVTIYGRSQAPCNLKLPSGVAIEMHDGESYRAWLENKLRTARPDIVQVENRPLLAASLRRRLPRSLPVVLALHSITYITPGRRRRKAIATALRTVDGVLTNCNGLREYVRATYSGVCRRLWRVYLGIDCDTFRPETDPKARATLRRDLRASLGLPADVPIILFVGRLIPQKGAHHLVAALPAIRRRAGDVRLVLVGGTRCGGFIRTRYFTRLERRIRALGGAAVLAGYVPHELLPSYYAGADVVATPSMRHEAFSFVNLEAMASGLPVVATRLGGTPEAVVSGQTGILISPTRIRRELAPAVIQALAAAAELGERARQRVERRFSWEQTAEGYAAIYRSLLEQRRPRLPLSQPRLSESAETSVGATANHGKRPGP